MLAVPNLLPLPRRMDVVEGVATLRDGRLIILDAGDPQALRFAAKRFQQALLERFELTWEIVAGAAIPASLAGLTLRLAPDRLTRAQAYDLSITPDSILVEAHDPAGIFYGVCTLIQILESAALDAIDSPASTSPSTLNPPTSNFRPPTSTRHSPLPCLHIADWPDFPMRGVLLDISRDKVPTLPTLLELVDQLSGWKINQLQLYTEHTFAYRNHPDVWANASPLTGQDILELDAFCRERHVELVPNQNSFGHMHRWLIHPRYAPLAEIAGSFETPWGERKEGPFSLCPLDPGSLDLVRSLYDELLPHFTSRMFNVGCDETFDLGYGRSKAACEARGSGRVYLDYLLKIHTEVTARRRTMQFWDDIIVQYPELIPELPKDTIALEWGYEAGHPFDAHGAQFATSGIPFYVCPGTSSWCSLAGRTRNALGNLLNAAENGLKHGASGYLNTDWGDDGHWQPLPVSYLGFVAGAAYGWSLEANRDLDVPGAVSWHAFRDPTGAMGRLAYDLGNTYSAVGVEPPNSSALFWIMQWPIAKVREYSLVSADAFQRTLDAIDQAMHELGEARMMRSDAGLITREFETAAGMLRHACRRGLFALDPGAVSRAALDQELQDLMRVYESNWLARNRPGGLSDSLARFEIARADYRNL